MKSKTIHVDELIYAAAKERLAAAGWNDIDYSSLRVRARAERNGRHAQNGRGWVFAHLSA